MSRFFPHTPYAEDQPLARTILATHVATRGLTTGTMLGVGAHGVGRAVARLRGKPGKLGGQAAPRWLRPAGVGAVAGTLAVSAGLAARMRGRGEIEWRDRSWRLLENRGQLETDDWTYAGMALGVVGAAAARTGGRGGALGVVGAAGLGSVGGMLGYLAWRYGVNGGKFAERPDMKT